MAALNNTKNEMSEIEENVTLRYNIEGLLNGDLCYLIDQERATQIQYEQGRSRIDFLRDRYLNGIGSEPAKSIISELSYFLKSQLFRAIFHNHINHVDVWINIYNNWQSKNQLPLFTGNGSIEQIVAERWHNGKKQYLVGWKGLEPIYDRWIDDSNLLNPFKQIFHNPYLIEEQLEESLDLELLYYSLDPSFNLDHIETSTPKKENQIYDDISEIEIIKNKQDFESYPIDVLFEEDDKGNFRLTVFENTDKINDLLESTNRTLMQLARKKDKISSLRIKEYNKMVKIKLIMDAEISLDLSADLREAQKDIEDLTFDLSKLQHAYEYLADLRDVYELLQHKMKRI